MPRYDYQCQACGHRFELKQSFQDPAAADCPQCGAGSQRLIHAPQVVYKARGFSDYDRRRTGFGSYWYNREVEADERAARGARGETEPGDSTGPAVPLPSDS